MNVASFEYMEVVIKPQCHPYIKGLVLDQDNMANYCPVSVTFLSKVIEWAVRDQLWKVLKENKMIPAHQSAYRKLHSTDCSL